MPACRRCSHACVSRDQPVAGLALDRPLIMGIVNVTPDSFSDGGRFLAADAAIEHALRLEAEGADILDIGGESTRPGSGAVDLDEECRRVLPVIAGARQAEPRAPFDRHAQGRGDAARSRAGRAHHQRRLGAHARSARPCETAAGTGLPVVLMHAQGEPRTMQDDRATTTWCSTSAIGSRSGSRPASAAGMSATRLIVDPGIGFGKTLAHNLALLGSLGLFHGLGCAVLLGASRKSFIGRLTGAGADDRLPGSIAAALVGASQGAQILRVHDVAATRQALALWQGTFAGR